jgi:hypothetical protein
MQCAPKACDRNPAGQNLDHDLPPGTYKSVTARHFADDAAFGEKLFHWVACSVVVQNYAFAQLSVPFGAGAESLSVSLSVLPPNMANNTDTGLRAFGRY